MDAPLLHGPVDEDTRRFRHQPPSDGGRFEPAARLGRALRDVHRPEEHAAPQLAVGPDAVDPAGVGCGLVRVPLEEGAARRRIPHRVGESDVASDALASAVHVGEELLGPPRLQRAQLALVSQWYGRHRRPSIGVRTPLSTARPPDRGKGRRGGAAHSSAWCVCGFSRSTTGRSGGSCASRRCVRHRTPSPHGSRAGGTGRGAVAGKAGGAGHPQRRRLRAGDGRRDGERAVPGTARTRCGRLGEPPTRSRGVGDLLVSDVGSWAREPGATSLRLKAVRGNKAAEALYVRNGFVAEDAARAEGAGERVMVRSLVP